MGQKEKAREMVNELFQISLTSALDAEQIREKAIQAAFESKRGFGAGIRHEGNRLEPENSLISDFSIRGPGGFISIMDFAVEVEPNSNGSAVSIHVGDFVFEKGPLGMKPRINAKSTMDLFIKNLKSQL